MQRFTAILTGICLLASAFSANSGPNENFPRGLNAEAQAELVDSGLTRYVGAFSPALSTDVGDGWTKHTFDPAAGSGPLCIAGTPYSVFSKPKNPAKLLIMLQGGGACWQDFYRCNIRAEDQEPPPPPVGIWGDSDVTTDGDVVPNPVGDWSVLYMPYCDGSVFIGDNDVVDPAFQAFIENQLGLPPGSGPLIRFHRGVRNVTAGIDLAKKLFPRASRVLVAGSSAGGAGVANFAPLLARMAFGNNKKLMVFNDAGPVATNPFDVEGSLARAADWNFGQFLPASCDACDPLNQDTSLIEWRLKNDSTIREAFFSTDADTTNRFFLRVPTQELYRQLILSEHGAVNAAYPDRYKRFIKSGDTTHTALQRPFLYEVSVNGIALHEWLDDFLVPRPSWVDVVEDFVPVE